jgi:entericidin B
MYKSKTKNRINVIALIVFLFFSAAILSGCNTVQGVGEDVEAGGQGIQDMAD